MSDHSGVGIRSALDSAQSGETAKGEQNAK